MSDSCGMILFGTRPEAIKILTVVQELERQFGIEGVYVCCSGQHSDLVTKTQKSIKLAVNVNFDLMTVGQTPAEITQKVIARTIEELECVKPKWIMVHGDTATTLGGALAGFYSHVPVIHLEAGLRTFDKDSPWPEEGIRQAVTRFASYHLAPTPIAYQNLLDENVSEDKIKIVGNPGADLILQNNTPNFFEKEGMNDDSKKVLVTIHRRENQGTNLLEILRGLEQLASLNSKLDIVFVMHPNPQSHLQVNAFRDTLSGAITDVIRFVEPLPYQMFQLELRGSSLVITDSGGLQEEAALLGVPTLIARSATERPEITDLNLAKIVALNEEDIAARSIEMLSFKPSKEGVKKWRELQGSGKSGARAVAAIKEFFPK